MKKTIIILSAIVIVVSCSGQNNKNTNTMKKDMELIKVPVSVGLGTLDISFNLTVPLYRSENDEAPIDTLTFTRDEKGVWHYETNRLNSFRPYIMEGGDTDEEAIEHINIGLIRFPPRLSFRVLEANDNFYRVVVNESSFETVVIRKDPDYMEWLGHALGFYEALPALKMRPNIKGYYFYETWERLLLRAQFINFNGSYSVHEAPEGKKIFKKTDRKFLPYSVMQVSGDWLKVEKARGGYDGYFEGIQNAEGWVKWKNDTEILVKITEYTIE